MATAVLNNPFPVFNQISTKGKYSLSRKQKRTDFDQPVPSVEKLPAYRNSDYLLDSLSQAVSNQTLSPEQLAKSQSRVVDEKIDSLKETFEINKIEDVKNFLLKNRDLFPLLEEISNRIYQYFGDKQKLSLKVSHEPDFPQTPELWVSILTEYSAKEALPILEKFDEEWWLENMDRSAWKLNINLKFV